MRPKGTFYNPGHSKIQTARLTTQGCAYKGLATSTFVECAVLHQHAELVQFAENHGWPVGPFWESTVYTGLTQFAEDHLWPVGPFCNHSGCNSMQIDSKHLAPQEAQPRVSAESSTQRSRSKHRPPCFDKTWRSTCVRARWRQSRSGSRRRSRPREKRYNPGLSDQGKQSNMAEGKVFATKLPSRSLRRRVLTCPGPESTDGEASNPGPTKDSPNALYKQKILASFHTWAEIASVRLMGNSTGLTHLILSLAKQAVVEVIRQPRSEQNHTHTGDTHTQDNSAQLGLDQEEIIGGPIEAEEQLTPLQANLKQLKEKQQEIVKVMATHLAGMGGTQRVAQLAQEFEDMHGTLPIEPTQVPVQRTNKRQKTGYNERQNQCDNTPSAPGRSPPKIINVRGSKHRGGTKHKRPGSFVFKFANTNSLSAKVIQHFLEDSADGIGIVETHMKAEHTPQRTQALRKKWDITVAPAQRSTQSKWGT